MKKIICVVLFCIGFTAMQAQEVYNSSGKPGFHRKTKKSKGYDPDKLIIGGGLNAGFGGGYASAGISPIVGYRFTKRFSAGVGLGYQYYKAPAFEDPYNNVYYQYEQIVYPSVWGRYFVYRNIFVDATVEYDFIGLKYPLDNYGNLNPVKSTVNNTCLLLGAGIRQPLGGRVSFYGELVYDVLQGEYSPYLKGSPDIRFGIAAGL